MEEEPTENYLIAVAASETGHEINSIVVRKMWIVIPNVVREFHL